MWVVTLLAFCMCYLSSIANLKEDTYVSNNSWYRTGRPHSDEEKSKITGAVGRGITCDHQTGNGHQSLDPKPDCSFLRFVGNPGEKECADCLDTMPFGLYREDHVKFGLLRRYTVG